MVAGLDMIVGGDVPADDGVGVADVPSMLPLLVSATDDDDESSAFPFSVITIIIYTLLYTLYYIFSN